MTEFSLELEELRRAGISRGPLRWVTNPLRAILFRLALPYFEVIGRALDRDGGGWSASAGPGRGSGLANRIRDDTLAGVRAEVRNEWAGARNEMRAMSHRFVSIEEMLHTISRWLEGIEQHTTGLAGEMRTELEGLRRRAETLERLMASSGGGGDSAANGLRGTGLVLAAGPYGRFLVRHPDVVGDAIIRGEFWDEHLKAAIEAHADPGRVAIDAGAYIGFHSVFLSRHFARVHAFEPQSQAYGLLRTNIELNGCRNVEATEAGLYSHACWLRLAPDAVQEVSVPRGADGIDYGALGNAAALAFVRSEEQAPGTVRGLTVDGLGLDGVGFIKVDTQGADLHVLRGAEATIRRCRPAIAFEFERDLAAAHGTGWDDFAAFFQALQYELAELRRTPDGKQTDYLARPA